MLHGLLHGDWQIGIVTDKDKKSTIKQWPLKLDSTEFRNIGKEPYMLSKSCSHGCQIIKTISLTRGH